jgi:hypothetical protein
MSSVSTDYVVGAAIITAAATVLLALATLYQALKTRDTVDQMKESRKIELIPKVKAFLYMAAQTYATLKIQNVGRGPALGVDLQIILKKDDSIVETRSVKPKIMLALEDTELILPNGLIDSILSSITSIEVKGSYVDTFGETIEEEETISVKEFVDNVKTARILWREKDGSLKPLRGGPFDRLYFP